MAKNKDGGGGGSGEGAIGGGGGGAGGQQPAVTWSASPSRCGQRGAGREREREGVREGARQRERLGQPGREAYPHLIQLTGAIWQLLAR